MTRSTTARDHGLQAERTTLAWTRTSFAFLANGALLMLRDFPGLPGSNAPAALIPAGLAAVVALGTYLIAALIAALIALRRQRTLGQRPLPTRVTARRPVYLVGVGVLLVIVVTVVAQLGQRA